MVSALTFLYNPSCRVHPEPQGRHPHQQIVMATNQYQLEYQRAYRRRKRQVTLTLEIEEYRVWRDRADRAERSVGQQILAEAQTHRDKTRLPSKVEEQELRELIRIWRGLGTLFNQLAHQSNTFRRLLHERKARALLADLEDTAAAWIRGHVNEPPHDL